MKRLWLILFLIFIGCATTTQNLPKPNRDILNKGNVRIKLTRSSEYYGAGLGFTVYDNGNLVGKLGSGGVFTWDRPEGKVTLSRDWNFSRGSVANNSISFWAEKGYGYEIYVSYTGGFSTSPYVGDPNAGREVIMHLLDIYSEYRDIDTTSPMSFGNATNKGCNIYGKIKFVEYGEDYKVRFVDYGANLKVKYVEYGESSKGNWKMVEYGEDYKIKIVSYGEDFTVKTVSYGQGCN